MIMELRVENVHKQYDTAGGPLRVLRGVSMRLDAGEAVAVVGPSGSGKSTLLNIIGSLDRPTAGSVRLGDEEVTELTGPRLAGFRSRCVGFIFQDHHLLPQCTALENVMLPTLPVGSSAEAVDLAGKLLERVGLGDKLNSFPAELSGGERQRVAVARSMVNGPALLLCDEPTGNLDQETAGRIGSLFAELTQEKNMMLVVATHNRELAGRFSRCMELKDGILRPAGMPAKP